jgi:hypothetical protein
VSQLGLPARTGRRASAASTACSSSTHSIRRANGASSSVLSQFIELRCCILIKPLSPLLPAGGEGEAAGPWAGCEGEAGGVMPEGYREVSCRLVVKGPVVVVGPAAPAAEGGREAGGGGPETEVLPPGGRLGVARQCATCY